MIAQPAQPVQGVLIPEADPAGAKRLGAYYTDARIADFLVAWALRSPADTVVDPSFGGGVFLSSAAARVAELGGQPGRQVFGVEIDGEVRRRVADDLAARRGVAARNLVHADFFAVDCLPDGPVDAVVGNPPFIRYQRFGGPARERALGRALAQGVRLTRLASSWAPFLIHGAAMLKHGGRLAMVIPMEIGHAAYARPVLRHLASSFRTVTFLTFRRKLFPDLSEDTLLLLADDKGPHEASFRWRDVEDAAALAGFRGRELSIEAGTLPLRTRALVRGDEKLVESWLPPGARDLYHRLAASPPVCRLGELADVGIGYVTGANDYFHLDSAAARHWDIPARFLRPAVRRGGALEGLRYTEADWAHSLARGEGAYLLSIDADAGAPLPEGIRRYIAHGVATGVAEAYKCRVRSPWYRVPHVHKPDAFLSYMSGTVPRLVANDAGAVAPNSLHIVRIRPGHDLPADALAALWRTSLTGLSAEIEGHALGGGMLKLEPTEAENVLVAAPCLDAARLVQLARELDPLERAGDTAGARTRADAVILQEGLGLTDADCRLLTAGMEMLRRRRCGSGR